MGFLRVWIHLVWSTRNRFPYLTKNIRYKVFDHIRENARNKGIYLDHINGYVEHVHCLISLNSSQNLATIVNLLKGESSFWINKNELTKVNFAWQEEYYTISVSPSQVNAVREYIRNQEEHHRTKTWLEETEDFNSITPPKRTGQQK
jgi:putative transposase